MDLNPDPIKIFNFFALRNKTFS